MNPKSMNTWLLQSSRKISGLQSGQASLEFCSALLLGILLVSSSLLVVWLLSLKLYLQALVLEASATAAQNLVLSFNNRYFIDDEVIKIDVKTRVGKFPFIGALGLDAAHSRFELGYFSESSNREFTQKDLVAGAVDAANIDAIQVRFYFCLTGLARDNPFFNLQEPVSSAADRDCLGQMQSRRSGHLSAVSGPNDNLKSKSLRLLFVSASHATLQSTKILRSGLQQVDMQHERQFLYKNFFREQTPLKENSH